MLVECNDIDEASGDKTHKIFIEIGGDKLAVSFLNSVMSNGV